MSLETEAVLDRRRMRRSISTWRIVAVIAAVIALGVVAMKAAGGRDETGLFATHEIARVSLTGMITEDRKQLALLNKIAKSPNVDAVILYVNSPGGTTAGGEALFEEIRRLARKKPVVAQFGTIATSAAYIAGLATDHIIAHGNTITGSVGVIFQWAEVSELLGKVGVKFNEVKSGPLKAVPSPFQPLDAAGRATTERMVADSMNWFKGLVATRRKIDTSTVPGLEQGAIFSGREAIRYKLIDGIGGEREAIAWLETKRNIKKGLKVVDWKEKSSNTFGLLGLAGMAFRKVLGLDDLPFAGLGGSQSLNQLANNGLVSIWQPSER
ncbi:MAG: signal peptide peptidase SppA [Hyphomicrobiaceae bacterium]